MYTCICVAGLPFYTSVSPYTRTLCTILLALSPGSLHLAHAHIILYDLCTRIKVKTPESKGQRVMCACEGRAGEETTVLLFHSSVFFRKYFQGGGANQYLEKYIEEGRRLQLKCIAKAQGGGAKCPPSKPLKNPV